MTVTVRSSANAKSLSRMFSQAAIVAAPDPTAMKSARGLPGCGQILRTRLALLGAVDKPHHLRDERSFPVFVIVTESSLPP